MYCRSDSGLHANNETRADICAGRKSALYGSPILPGKKKIVMHDTVNITR